MGGVCLTSGAEEPLPQTHPRILRLQRETEGMSTTTHPVAGAIYRERDIWPAERLGREDNSTIKIQELLQHLLWSHCEHDIIAIAKERETSSLSL